MTPKRGINNASDPQSKHGKWRSYNSLGHTEGAGEWSKQTNQTWRSLVIILVERMVCNIGQINDRNNYKKKKYLDLRLGLRKLYPVYEIKQTTSWEISTPPLRTFAPKSSYGEVFFISPLELVDKVLTPKMKKKYCSPTLFRRKWQWKNALIISINRS